MKTPILLLILAGCDDVVDTGLVEGLMRDNLGQITIGYDGKSDELTIDAPSGAVSGLIACQDIGDQYYIQLFSLYTPDGGIAWSSEDPEAHPYRADILDDVSTVLIPEAPELDIAPGAWKAVWITDKALYQRTLDCEAAWRMDDVRDTALNLDIYLVDVTGMSASTAAENIGLQAMLAETYRLWDDAFDAGTINYKDITEDTDTYTVLNIGRGTTAYVEFNDLMRMADSSPTRTVPVFLVKEIWDYYGDEIYGMSGGPPGAATIMHTSKSGVVVGTASIDDNPEFVGHVLAHEIGHYLGLFHTTDKDGESWDCLDDTPECPIENDINGNDVLNTDECQELDTYYLMFWTGNNNETISEDQNWVTERNPAVR